MLCRLAGLAIVLAFGAAEAAEPVGRVDAVEGRADLIKPGGDTAERLAVGAALFLQDIIRTDDDAKARLLFKDGTQVTVGPGSTLKITNYVYSEERQERSALITVPEGIFRAVVSLFVPDSRFEVQTATAVASVQGTEWMTESNLDTTDIVVLDGAVAVTSVDRDIAGEVVLRAGEGTEVRAGAAPSPPRTWGQPRVNALADRTTLD